MSDDRYPWYRWDVRRYRASDRVLAMTPLQRGIYRELLDVVWIKGWIPASDLVQLAQMARVSVAMMQKNWPTIRDMFIALPGMDGERLTSETLEEERRHIDKRRAQASEAGRKSAEARNDRSTTVQRTSTKRKEGEEKRTEAPVTHVAELPTANGAPPARLADVLATLKAESLGVVS